MIDTTISSSVRITIIVIVGITIVTIAAITTTTIIIIIIIIDSGHRKRSAPTTTVSTAKMNVVTATGGCPASRLVRVQTSTAMVASTARGR